jgi:hypothetical protein
VTNGSIAPARSARSTMARRCALACLLAAVVTPSIGHARMATAATTIKIVMQSGLYTFSPGHSGFVTVAATGAIGASSHVTIEFRDDTDTLVAVTTGELRRGTPVRLRALESGDRLFQLRTTITIVSSLAADTRPVAVFEDLGPDSIVARIIVCGPPARTGGGQEYCPGWSITSRTE